MLRRIFVITLLFLYQGSADETFCPHILNNPLHSHLPYGVANNITTGVSFKKTNHTDLEDCVNDCCHTPSCNAALTITQNGIQQCLFISCASDELCLPASQASDFESTLVLVHPNNPPWKNISVPEPRVCEVGLGLEACRPGEICQALGHKSRNGVCTCDKGYLSVGDSCVPATTTTIKVPVTPSPVLEVVTIPVSVVNKTIYLPEKSATLTAYAVGVSKNQTFKYEWKTQTNLPGTESNANSETLKLSGLSEGVYIFKVAISSTSPIGYGEAMANVTVLPMQRVNTPPHAKVSPPTQNLTLPTNKAVIDGSKSTDDGGEMTYTWAITSGPMGYERELPHSSTLTLDDLIAGNYTVQLTVKDEDGETDSAVAHLLVLKETDYPPVANAGADRIIFLPTNTVILNGNQSSDDHEIRSWEWTKKKPEEGIELPADITGARTPYLNVANLEKGTYNFVLKVTDSSGQSKTDEVSVYVKPPSNLAPTANAGEDMDLSLPLPYFTLDGRKSTDDLNITQYAWKQIDSQRALNISKPNQATTNVTNIVPGKFTFQLTVSDANGNKDSATVVVTIKQDSNQAPVAKIKPPENLEMPVGVLVLDASQSSDDLAIESWQWSRSPESVSAGRIVGNTDGSSLTLTDLVPGIYVFNVKVFDGQGKSDVCRISFTVKEDKNKLASVEMVLDKDLSLLSQADLNNILDAIKIFLKSKTKVEVVSLHPASRTGFATLVFKVKSTQNKYMKGSDVVAELRRTLMADPGLLGAPVLQLETSVCQNECGGHGTCDELTRECRCQPFWVENPVSRHIFQGPPNCDWSVIYVAVGCLVVLLLLLLLYCLCCGCRRRKKTKYARLGANDIELSGNPAHLISTDSDSEDEEVIFESSKKGRRANGVARSNLGTRSGSNGSQLSKKESDSLENMLLT